MSNDAALFKQKHFSINSGINILANGDFRSSRQPKNYIVHMYDA